MPCAQLLYCMNNKHLLILTFLHHDILIEFTKQFNHGTFLTFHFLPIHICTVAVLKCLETFIKPVNIITLYCAQLKLPLITGVCCQSSLFNQNVISCSFFPDSRHIFTVLKCTDIVEASLNE